MRKIKIEERMKNAVNAFFVNAAAFDENRLNVTSENTLLKQENEHLCG